MNNTVKLGLILAAIGIVTQSLYKFVLGYDFLFSWKPMLITFVINVVITVIIARKLFRDPEEGRLGYGQAVKKLFLAYLIGTVITQIFSIAIFANDNEMKVAFEEYTITSQEAGVRMAASLTGVSEADVAAQLQRLEEQRESGEIPAPTYPYIWSQLPLGIFMGAVIAIFMALILAIFVKEKETSYSGV